MNVHFPASASALSDVAKIIRTSLKKEAQICVGLALLFCLLSVGCMTPAAQNRTQQEMESVIAKYEAAFESEPAVYDHHFIRIFNDVLGREPTAAEYEAFLEDDDHRHVGVGMVLAYCIRAKAAGDPVGSGALIGDSRSGGFFPRARSHPKWRDMQRFCKQRSEESDLSSRQCAAVARELKMELRKGVSTLQTALTDDEVAAPILSYTRSRDRKRSYNAYFGYLHAHSNLSWDASGKPEDAYRHAREEAGLDFFSLSDHSESFIWIWERRWQRLRDVANRANDSGEFVAFFGYEWSSPFFGHISIFNVKNYINFLSHFTPESVYRWINCRGGRRSFATFNHPGRRGSQEFSGFRRRSDNGLAQLVGIEVWNKKGDFDEWLYNRKRFDGETGFHRALNRGWLVAPVGGQDNHSRDWGTRNDMRIGVWATKLTRNGIAEAFRARRVFASEDKNMEVDFRSNGFPMGSRLRGKRPRQFSVWVRDPDPKDTIASIQFYRNGEMIEKVEIPPGTSEVTPAVVFNDSDNEEAAYYYVIVSQVPEADQAGGRGHEAVTAPIWFD